MNTVNGIDIEAPWRSKQPLQRAIYGQPRYQGRTLATYLMPAAQPVKVELEIRPDESCNDDRTLEGESNANSH